MSARPLMSALSLVLLSVLVGAAEAVLVQQGPKLTISPSGIFPTFGTSVAVSANGRTAIIGSPGIGTLAGSAFVATRAAGLWSLGAPLVGTGAVNPAIQGQAVALSADGNTAVVGGPGDDSGAGAAWIFTRNGGIWSQQGGKLVGTGSVGGANQGQSVAVSADGNTVVAGGSVDDGGVGAAWVFTRSGGAWSQQGAKLVGAGAVGAANLGASVSISADGNTVLVGGNADDGNAGAVWVFARSGGVWSQQGGKLVGVDAVGPAQQGVSVSLSADGNTALVGGSSDNADVGAAWVFTRSGDAWTQHGGKLAQPFPYNQTSGQLGKSVALSASGTTAAVGAWAEGGSGVIVVYTLSGGVWGQPGVRLNGGGATTGASQGAALAVSGDGSDIVVGGFGDNGGIGAVWVFARAEPVVMSVLDIPGDQGGWVRLTVEASGSDFVTSLPVSMYGVWRVVPESPLLATPVLDFSLAAIPATVEIQRRNGRVFAIGRSPDEASPTSTTAFPPGTWELVASVPALQLDPYVIAVPTVSNAAPNEFVVTASTTTPSVWYISQPMTGQSVDNLAPAPPAPFTAAYAGGATHLHWGRNGEPDAGVYHLHRGSSAGFSPALGNIIASQGDTGFVDTGPAGSFYKLSALDVNGNESGYALVTPDATLGAGDRGSLAFALERVRPNPSRGPRLVMSFTLPVAAPARLELLDIGGRRLLVQEVGALGTGRHSVELVAGHRLPPGLYLVRLMQNRESRVTRVAIVE